MYFWLGSFQNYPFSRTGYNFVVANVNSFEKRGPHLEIRVANAQKHTIESFFLEWGGGRVILSLSFSLFSNSTKKSGGLPDQTK